MIRRNLGGVVPPVAEPGPDEEELVRLTLAAVQTMQERLAAMQLDRGVAEVLAAVRAGNRYFDRLKPWALAKAGDNARLAHVLYHAAECLRIVSGLLLPVMPARMTDLRRTLGLTDDAAAPALADLSRWGGLRSGHPVADIEALFPRVEKPAVSEAAPPPQGVARIGIDDFGRMQLLTAKVVAAEPVAGSGKLLKLTLEVGPEQRQIVAGIARFYEPAALVGRTVVIVANLKPAMLCGVESQGMLLAASAGKHLRLLTTDGEIASGASVG